MSIYDTIATLDALFEEIKPDYFHEALIKSSEMWGVRIGDEGKAGAVVNRQKAPGPSFVIPVKYAGEEGVAAITEGDLDIPQASPGKRTETSVTMAYIAGSTEITDIALDNLNTKAAIVDYAAEKLSDLKDAILAFYVRAFTFNFKNGSFNGYLGEIEVPASTTITIDTSGVSVSFRANGAAEESEYGPGAWYLRPGMRIDIYEGISKQGTAVVIDVSRDRKTAVLATESGTVELSNGTGSPKYYYVYMQNSRAKEPVCYDYIASVDRTLQGLDSTTYSFWDGYVTDASTLDDYDSSNGLTVNCLRTHLDGQRNTLIGTPKITKAFTTLHQLRHLENDFFVTYNYAPQRIEPGDDLVYGGWGIVVEGVRVIYDPYVPPGRCYTPSYPTLIDYYVSDLKWRKVGGKIWYPLEGQMKHRAVLMMSRQLATTFAGHQGKIVRLKGDFD